MESLPVTASGDLAFGCPRCKNAVEERFYGVCAPCRTELRATMRHQPREVATEAYAPKMNVVPNLVALKDDSGD